MNIKQTQVSIGPVPRWVEPVRDDVSPLLFTVLAILALIQWRRTRK